MATRDLDDVFNALGALDGIGEDLAAIREGRYEAPRGAKPHDIRATPDDIYSRLGGVIGHLERINEMLYAIGEHITGDPEGWNRRINRY